MIRCVPPFPQASFNNIEVPHGRDFMSGCFDIVYAFYVLGVSLDLAERFGSPAVSNKHLGFASLKECFIPPNEMLLPCLRFSPWNSPGRSTCAKRSHPTLFPATSLWI